MKIILASQSPRRKDILSMLGIPFDILPADIDESLLSNEDPSYYVHRLSIEKAQALAKEHNDSLVIGSDLTVDVDRQSLAKAENVDEARQMLELVSGKTHYTRCGYAVMKGDTVFSSGVVTTEITFKEISDNELKEYLDSGQWKGLAGSYGVQGSAAKFVQKFVGSYYDILGLPIYEIASILGKFGISIDEKHYNKLVEFDKKKIYLLNNS